MSIKEVMQRIRSRIQDFPKGSTNPEDGDATYYLTPPPKKEFWLGGAPPLCPLDLCPTKGNNNLQVLMFGKSVEIKAAWNTGYYCMFVNFTEYHSYEFPRENVFGFCHEYIFGDKTKII